MSILKVNTIQKKDGTTFPIGKINQVIQSTSTATFNASSNGSFATGIISSAITPIATTSKILVEFNVTAHGNSANGNNIMYFQVARNIDGGSYSVVGDRLNRFRTNSGLHDSVQTIKYLDSPSSTGELKYQLYIYRISGTPYLNPNSDSQTITLMEVLA